MNIYYNTIFGFIAQFCAGIRTIFTRDFDHHPMFTENCKVKSVDICQLFYLNKSKGHHITFDNLLQGCLQFSSTPKWEPLAQSNYEFLFTVNPFPDRILFSSSTSNSLIESINM